MCSSGERKSDCRNCIIFMFFEREASVLFSVGELIVYGSMGVCRVEAVELRNVPGGGQGQFYVLQPVYQKCAVSTPVDNDKIVMRPIISREEADRLIDTIPNVHAEAYHNKVLRQLTEYYESIIKLYDCAKLIELLASIYDKKRICAQMKKKFGALDERYMKRAEDMLFGEFAAALGIERCEVARYISDRIGIALE